ncbi:unnamed protein product [Brassica rapa subsp. narinosa]
MALPFQHPMAIIWYLTKEKCGAYKHLEANRCDLNLLPNRKPTHTLLDLYKTTGSRPFHFPFCTGGTSLMVLSFSSAKPISEAASSTTISSVFSSGTCNPTKKIPAMDQAFVNSKKKGLHSIHDGIAAVLNASVSASPSTGNTGKRASGQRIFTKCEVGFN